MEAEMPASPGGGSHGSDDQSSDIHKFLPITVISRIMRDSLPGKGKITQHAKETMLDCVTEFITFITSEASEMCEKQKRRIINGDDILGAMATLRFEDYIDPLRLYLQKYREMPSFLGKQRDFRFGMGDAGVLQGENLAGPSVQEDMMMLQHASFTEGMGYLNTQRDAGVLQGGSLAGPGMQGDMMMLQQASFTEGMGYLNTQVPPSEARMPARERSPGGTQAPISGNRGHQPMGITENRGAS